LLTAGFSVADLCRRWRVGADKIHGFLRRGELIGVNVAASLSGRLQWRITRESVEAFERRRSSAPTPKVPRRRKRTTEIDFYPDEPAAANGTVGEEARGAREV
jgi:hypothetical protein